MPAPGYFRRWLIESVQILSGNLTGVAAAVVMMVSVDLATLLISDQFPFVMMRAVSVVTHTWYYLFATVVARCLDDRSLNPLWTLRDHRVIGLAAIGSLAQICVAILFALVTVVVVGPDALTKIQPTSAAQAGVGFGVGLAIAGVWTLCPLVVNRGLSVAQAWPEAIRVRGRTGIVWVPAAFCMSLHLLDPLLAGFLWVKAPAVLLVTVFYQRGYRDVFNDYPEPMSTKRPGSSAPSGFP